MNEGEMMSKQKGVELSAALLLGLLGLLVMVHGASAATSVVVSSTANGALTMLNLHVTPQRIVAGENVTMSFNMFNSYDSPLYDLSLQLTGDSRILNVSPTNNYIITAVGSGNYGGAGYDTVTYTVHIPASLQTGEYTFDVIATYRTNLPNNEGSVVAMSDMPVSIYVYGTPTVTASIASAMPQQLFPGGNQTLEIALQNTGTSTAKNVTAVFTGSGGLSIGGINRFFVGSIPAGSSVTEQLFVQAINDTTSGEVAIPVVLNYSSDYASNITSNGTIYVNVQSGPTFAIQNMSSNLNKGDSYDPVTYRIRNTGNGAATDISFSLVTNYPISPVDPNAFVSSLAPGQSANVTFYVSVDTHASPGSYPVTIYEQWKQPNAASSQLFSGSSSYYAQVGSAVGSAPSSANSGILTGMSGIIDVAAAIVVIALIALFAIRRRSRRQKQAAVGRRKQ